MNFRVFLKYECLFLLLLLIMQRLTRRVSVTKMTNRRRRTKQHDEHKKLTFTDCLNRSVCGVVKLAVQLVVESAFYRERKCADTTVQLAQCWFPGLVISTAKITANSYCVTVILSFYGIVVFCIIVYLAYVHCIDFTGI